MWLFRRSRNSGREFIPSRQEIRESSRFTAKDLLGGKLLTRDVVTRQIPFLLFWTTAILFYILNQYRGERIMTQVTELEKKIRELRAESVSVAFDLQELSKQSEVSIMLENNGMPLKEAMTPPYIIVLDN